MCKLNICLQYQCDAVMDLSTGDNLDRLRADMIKNSR